LLIARQLLYQGVPVFAEQYDRQLLAMVLNRTAGIREGAFGECVSCGNEINAKRLEAVPGLDIASNARKSWKKANLKRPD